MFLAVRMIRSMVRDRMIADPDEPQGLSCDEWNSSRYAFVATRRIERHESRR